MQLTLAEPFIESWAIFDDTKTYRYQLGRRWVQGTTILWILLNPSTADDVELDPTLKRVLDFSRRYGHGAFEVGNVYGFRSPYPEDLWAPCAANDPVGPENLHHLEVMAKRADLVMVGWGTDAKPEHVLAVREVLSRVDTPPYCLKRNADGSPTHPLYLPKILQPKLWLP